MRKKLLISAVILLSVVIQAGILPVFFQPLFIPQITLMIVVSGTAFWGFKKFFGWSVFAGAVSDIFLYNIIGREIIIFSVTSYAVSFLSRRFLVENKFWGSMVLTLYVLGATLFFRIYSLAFEIIISKNYADLKNTQIFFSGLIIQALCNLALFFICLWLITKIDRKLKSYSIGN